MIIFTARLPRFQFSTAVVAATVVTSALLVFGLAKSPYQAVISQEDSVKTPSQGVAYLRQWGWEVEETALSSQTLLIPEDLDQSYQAYLDLQTDQGFPSLWEFRGETVQRYTYLISNYPTGATDMQVNLLLYQDQVIGGEVLSPQVDGIVHGLAMPSS